MRIDAAHLVLYVRDQARSARFWRAVLGAAPRLDVPGMTEFALGPRAVLGLMSQDAIARLLPALPPSSGGSEPPRAEVYLMVDDPRACHARALGAGARELSPLARRSWGHVAAYSLDPDGHVVAFARDAAGER
jgi:catechol 2,3-dioxygenase-like lactoylglutathione lyase family enzyme